MALQVVKFGVIPAVSPEDPEWLETLFGDFRRFTNLALSRFPHHSEWPEPDPCKQCEVVRFKGERFRDLSALDERLTAEGYGADRRTYPFDLAITVIPRVEDLWRGPMRYGHIYPSSPLSVKDGYEGPYLPYVSINSPENRAVYSHWVEMGFGSMAGFLVLSQPEPEHGEDQSHPPR